MTIPRAMSPKHTAAVMNSPVRKLAGTVCEYTSAAAPAATTAMLRPTPKVMIDPTTIASTAPAIRKKPFSMPVGQGGS
jgi:hypothetical protein